MSHTAAYEEGYKAGIDGLDPRECPHPKQTMEWNEWQRAHAHGCDMARWNTEQQAIHG